MNIKNKIKVEQGRIKNMLIQSVRYSMPRDNHIAPANCADDIKELVPLFEKKLQTNLVNQLIHEIQSGLNWHNKLKYKYVWEGLITWLVMKKIELEDL